MVNGSTEVFWVGDFFPFFEHEAKIVGHNDFVGLKDATIGW